MSVSLRSNGRRSIILPHGVLIRGSAEGHIRKALIDRNQIEATIGFQDKLFLNTSISVCVLVLRKNRMESDVLFVDASKGFEKLKNQKQLTKDDVTKMVDTVVNRKEEDKYSHLVTLEEIKENDYKFNIPRYVDRFEEEEPIDIVEVSQEIIKLNAEIEQAESILLAILNELAITPETKDLIEAAKGVFEYWKKKKFLSYGLKGCSRMGTVYMKCSIIFVFL